MGSTVETVVSLFDGAGTDEIADLRPGMPAIPSSGELIRVKSRSTCALSTMALAATTAASAASSFSDGVVQILPAYSLQLDDGP